jgi:hypothetical protein
LLIVRAGDDIFRDLCTDMESMHKVQHNVRDYLGLVRAFERKTRNRNESSTGGDVLKSLERFSEILQM